MKKNKLEKMISQTRKELKIDKEPYLFQNTELKEMILLVDDDKQLIRSLEFIFKDKYDIVSCYKGQDAITKFIKFKDKIFTVLLDIKMDDKNGIDVYKEIKQVNPAIPIIFNTAYPGEYRPLDLVQSLHPFGYIIKGSDPSILYDNIGSAVEHYKLTYAKDKLNNQLQEMVSDLKHLLDAVQHICSIMNKKKLFEAISSHLVKILNPQYVLFFSYSYHTWKLIYSSSSNLKKRNTDLIEMAGQILFELKKKDEMLFTKQEPFFKTGHKNKSIPSGVENIFSIPFFNQKNISDAIVIINAKNILDLSDSKYYLSRTLIQYISIMLKNIFLLNEKVKNKELSVIGKMAGTIIHDINNPLSVINSYMDALKLSLNKKKDHSYISVIKSELSRINCMIKELTGFINKDTLKIKLEKTKLDLLIKNYIDKVKDQYLERRIEIIYHSDFSGFINIDTGKILRAFQNILDNAKKAIEYNGTIIIKAFKKNRLVEIQIKDSGCGMDLKTCKKIFKPFFTGRKKGGLGLGMYIVQQLISQHNGSIGVVSQYGAGTTFIIKLPLA